MDIIKHNLFPSLVVEIPNFIDEKEITNILKTIKKNNFLLKKHKAFINNAMSSHSEDNFFKKLDVNFNNKLKQCLSIYAEQSGYSIQNIITNSWFNIQNKDSILSDHTHPLSTISGVVYIKISNESSPIYFFNPNQMINFTKINKNTSYASEWVYFKPKPGSILLFPSWLKHGSNFVKNKDKLRVSISFNCI